MRTRWRTNFEGLWSDRISTTSSGKVDHQGAGRIGPQRHHLTARLRAATRRTGRAAFKERWTGGYIFENEWQSFRTRQNRDLELTTPPHSYAKAGRYTVAVKVIDIFGNDTMTLVPVQVG